MSEVSGYIYHNPRELSRSIEVKPIPATIPVLDHMAGRFFEIMSLALKPQLGEAFVADHAEWQTQQIGDLGDRHHRVPVYLQAIDRLPGGRQGRTLRNLVGYGRPVEERRWLRANVANIGEIFIRPSYQGKGIGSAVLRSLLDTFPEDLPTAVYGSLSNSQLVRTLAQAHFRLIRAQEKINFGQRVEEAYLRGPVVGELIQIIEDCRPWLRDREPIAAAEPKPVRN